MSGFVQAESVNLEELRHALAEYPQIAFRFVGSRMKREGNRFRRRLIAERMSGLPGIKWGSKKKVGGNVSAKVSGTDLASLKLTAKGSRLLAVHEYGATISGRPWLYIRTDKEGHGAGGFESSFSPKGPSYVSKAQATILARVRQVVIPARLGFKNLFNSMMPEMLANLNEDLVRAGRVALERHLKAVSSAIQKIAV